MTSEGERVDLRKLLDEAAEGPWTTQGGFLIHGPDKGGIDIGPLLGEVYNRANGRAIAALRNAAPFLLDVVEAARIALDHPYESGPDNVCIHCGVIGSYGHMAEKRQVMLRNALPALDSHLSAASERETPE